MSSTSDLTQLEKELQDMLRNVEPARRRMLVKKLAQVLRKGQQQRITRQQNADGTQYQARSPRTEVTQQRLRFIYFGELRDLKNWKRGHNRITGWDNQRGAVRTFLRNRIERYISVETATTTKRVRKPQPMFRRLRTAAFLRAQAVGDTATVGFDGLAARIANVHQYGLEDQVNPSVRMRYPLRELLGVTPQDRELMLDAALDFIAGKQW
ncbi:MULTISPECIES: phage virion morphogenesis protein [unclassified Serratia (in: enterobacteria)]|uniref:phage virion morphogenesis protein n=1 Tax=unclassified Serratia (in: enterobacteria) TaxID=2647522 RepID=UPI00307666B3